MAALLHKVWQTVERQLYLRLPDAWVERQLARFHGDGVALMYHEILPAEIDIPAWTIVRAADFREQMLLLRRHFDIVGLDSALQHGNGARAKPYAVITFDDGYAGNLLTLLPIIEALEIPVTVFVASRAIEENSLYWYDRLIGLLAQRSALEFDLSAEGLGRFQVAHAAPAQQRWEAMQALLSALKQLEPAPREQAVRRITQPYAGTAAQLRMLTVAELQTLAASKWITIGGHSHCHNLLTQLGDDALRDTLAQNRQRLQTWTGKPIAHFAYPNGSYDARVRNAVEHAGFASAMTTEFGRWQQRCDRFLLPRISVGRFDSTRALAAKLILAGRPSQQRKTA